MSKKRKREILGEMKCVKPEDFKKELEDELEGEIKSVNPEDFIKDLEDELEEEMKKYSERPKVLKGKVRDTRVFNPIFSEQSSSNLSSESIYDDSKVKEPIEESNSHKEKCSLLKRIRLSIAKKLGREDVVNPEPCTFKGECSGTCPACENEEKKLNELLKNNDEKKVYDSDIFDVDTNDKLFSDFSGQVYTLDTYIYEGNPGDIAPPDIEEEPDIVAGYIKDENDFDLPTDEEVEEYRKLREKELENNDSDNEGDE